MNYGYLMPEAKRWHLSLVEESFRALGFHFYQGEGDESAWTWAEQTSEWSICWTWGYSKWDTLGPLSEWHRINHIPGNYVLVVKGEVYKTFRKLQEQFSPTLFDFIPQQFVLPQQIDEFKKAFEEEKNNKISFRNDNPEYGKRWLIKSQNHRGVRFFSGLDELENIMTTKDMVAKCIEPFLIGGHKFDVGLYVAITSVDPLRVYVYDNVLLRLCKKPYPIRLNEHSDVESYVVVDYMPPWEANEMKDMYTELPSSSNPGTNHWYALKKYLEKKGLDSDDFERDVYSMITKLIVANRHHFTTSIDQLKTKLPETNISSTNFFEMWRFDIMVEDTGKPYLMEANQSPNLVPKVFRDGISDMMLKQGVVSDLLTMVTTAAKSHNTPALVMDSVYCTEHCLVMLGNEWNMACWSCPNWYTPSEMQMLQSSSVEYAHRGKYKLLFPEISSSSTENSLHPPFSTFLKKESNFDRILSRYFTSFGARTTTSSSRQVYCIGRSQCSDHGDCLNGKCICDEGYEGHTCYIPIVQRNTHITSSLPQESTITTSSSREYLFIVTILLLLAYILLNTRRGSKKKEKYKK